RHFDDSAKGTRTAIRGGTLQFRVAAFDVGTQELGGPFGLLEVFNSGVDVVRQKALRRTEILDLGSLAVQSRLEDRVHHHVRIRVRSDGAHFGAHAALVANGDPHHRAAVDGRSIELIGRFEVRVEAAIGIYAGVEKQAD